MKTRYSALFLLFCLTATTAIQAQIQSVDYPVYSNKSSESVEITRVERNDTATIVFMDVYNRPDNWVRISSRSTLQGLTTGKNYKLLSSKGFELDKQNFMPASGNASFQLFFEPIDKKEQKISFIEGPNDGDYTVENIELNENYKKSRIRCRLSGTVIDRPQSSRLIICKDMSQVRNNQWLSIPIRDGKFDYTFYTDIEDRYYLMFWDEYIGGAMRPEQFFAENGEIQFTLHPMTMEEPITNYTKTTCPLTKELLSYREKEKKTFNFDDIRAAEDALEKADGYYTETYKAFWKKFDETTDRTEKDKLYNERDSLEESGAFYTEAAQALSQKSRLRYDSLIAWRLEYIKQYASLPCLYLLQETVDYFKHTKKDFTPCIDIYHKVFEKKFAKHPASKSFQQFVDGLLVKVGSTYVNFTAPDLQGNPIQLSDMIANKVALIDLWASWCGPCRRSSISMIPLYNKYKDKGFVIVGIAREKGTTKDMEAAIKKDGYTWLNLVELNDRAQIWSKYGISNAAGSTFLVDKSGRILAINPSAEEVEAILEKNL